MIQLEKSMFSYYNDKRTLDLIAPHINCQGEVPYSELAMHMKIAGKKIAFYIKQGIHGACKVTLVDGETYTGTIAELIPFEDRRES